MTKLHHRLIRRAVQFTTPSTPHFLSNRTSVDRARCKYRNHQIGGTFARSRQEPVLKVVALARNPIMARARWARPSVCAQGVIRFALPNVDTPAKTTVQLARRRIAVRMILKRQDASPWVITVSDSCLFLQYSRSSRSPTHIFFSLFTCLIICYKRWRKRRNQMYG